MAESIAKVELIVFISFSMPRQSLVELSKDAGKVDGVLNLRGWVDGSLPKTIVEVQKIMAESGWGMLTIPEYFDDCGISDVPTFVLADFDVTGNIKSFDKVSGNVTLDYALEEFTKRGEHHGDARILLDRLRSNVSD